MNNILHNSFSKENKKIVLIVFFYSLSVFSSLNFSSVINYRWIGPLILISGMKSISREYTNMPNIPINSLTFLFLLFSGMELMNLVTGISSTINGLTTLVSMALISFLSYRIPVKILTAIVSLLYYYIAVLVVLSAIQGLTGIQLISVEINTGEFTEVNLLGEQIRRFSGVFANPNSLAIYSIITTSFCIYKIMSALYLENNAYHWLSIARSTIFWVLIMSAAIYCGISTQSLQYPATMLLSLFCFLISSGTGKFSVKTLYSFLLGSAAIFFTWGWLQQLASTTSDERTGARTNNFQELIYNFDVFSHPFGLGFAQNNTNITIDIGPAKWFVELGVISAVLLMIYILSNMINIYKYKYSNKKNINDMYFFKFIYLNYITLIIGWTFQALIYSPLYATTTIWIILSIIIEKIDRPEKMQIK